MKKLLEKILILLPHFILVTLTGIILITSYRNNINYNQIINLIEVIIWPVIALIAFMFFKEVFTYLFFSMKEFNFFGAKGELKNVKDMIREKATELYNAEKREKEIKEIQENETKLKEENELLKKDSGVTIDQWNKFTDRIFASHENLLEKYKLQTGENQKLRDQSAALLNQVEYLQTELEKTKRKVVLDLDLKMKNCPKCGNLKFFFDQYHQNAFPEAYAMCKFCGYWKKEGEESKQCNMFFCGCPGSTKDRLGYDWSSSNQCGCQSCGKLLTEKDQVKWPAEDPNHPFRKL